MKALLPFGGWFDRLEIEALRVISTIEITIGPPGEEYALTAEQTSAASNTHQPPCAMPVCVMLLGMYVA